MGNKIADKNPKNYPIVFEEVPVDTYIKNNLSKLPDDLSPEIKQKLINDSKFFAEQGMTAEVPKNFVEILQQHRDKKKALKGIKKDMSNKKAYPNYDEYMDHKPPSNTNKWISAVKDMYYHVHKGSNKGEALDNITSSWSDVEKLDFKNWLKYYEENAHKKYSEAANVGIEEPISIKVGQIGYWEDVNRAGYFVPVHRETQVNDARIHVNEIDLAKDPSTNEGVRSDEKREIIENQRNKIVSRLDSAEKLLRSQEGQIFAGKEFEALMHIIYELKKKIHTVNKISTSTKLYEDMIIREANILTKKGYNQASKVLFKIAEDKPLTPPPPANPMSGAGNPGSIPGQAPGQVPPGNNSPTDVGDGMEGFLSGLNGEQDQSASDDLEVIEETDDNLIVEAQAAPATDVPPPPAPKQKPDENLEVNEDKISTTSSPFDQKMEQMFQGLKVEDVVQKLEDLTKIYKTREMPRQLSLIDMMLDHLGLAPFFPTLAEANTKALDSNQYILTRLEDITSRLRGTVQTNEIDLKGQNPIPSSPELEATRNKLQVDQDKEKARKEMRKKEQAAEIDQVNKPEPELEVEEDLAGPVDTTNAVPPPPVPAAPPTR